MMNLEEYLKAYNGASSEKEQDDVANLCLFELLDITYEKLSKVNFLDLKKNKYNEVWLKLCKTNVPNNDVGIFFEHVMSGSLLERAFTDIITDLFNSRVKECDLLSGVYMTIGYPIVKDSMLYLRFNMYHRLEDDISNLNCEIEELKSKMKNLEFLLPQK